MSIHKMIAAHPDVAGNLNEELATAVRHAMFCAIICTSCADACSAEKMDMVQCIRSCMDCADICDATARVATRRSGSNEAVIRSLLQTCIETCEICGAECETHEQAHCQLCAEMCRECATDCRKALATID
ncbi:four-helix bundle copper-binding protein [Sphingomonas oleivorans]|uniref:Four-helix bundle copper-binding protein n=1 Tax=Sphingomonas oleivorans TaxID=1735121 RepID=A0A2T5FWI0_9SPHN|nr:four-helix bundle copper-binding protein [Sphingomonas oleivorans]PTQ10140.1 four-helix bundle copper-binding protein [Sphingomonas oleivorans]